MLEKGAIYVYTGDGKGKTTAALGLAWRAISRGLKVYMVQFLKAPNTSGEQLSVECLSPLFTIRPMGRNGFIGDRPLEPEDFSAAQSALDAGRVAMLSGEYDVVILDEASVAVHKGILEVNKLTDVMAAKPEHVVLVVTGRNAHPDVVSMGDVVVEMRKIKHHFDNGVGALKGIDY